MPDYLEPVPAAQGQTDWPAMLRDLEKRVEVLSDALEGVKLSMRRLVLAEPWLKQATPQPTWQPEQPTGWAPAVEVAPLTLEYDDDAREAVRQAVQDAKPPVVEVGLPALEYDEDAREAARQVTEDSEVLTASGDWREETTDFVTEDKPEVSWITVPDDGSAPEPLPVVDEAPSGFVDNEDAREAVRRAVEAAKAELSYTTPAPADATPADADEAAREAVRRTVEEAKGGMGFGWGPVGSSVPPVEDEESHREAVRRAVEEARAETASPAASVEPAVEPVDEEAAREAVRQAVLQARAEMATNGGLAGEAPKPVEVAPAYVVPPPHRPERVHPPTITIEDPEGRVDLARVYNLLKHLDVAANSSLLNYSSRQVSVQLSDSRSAPDGGNVGDAVREVFERENEVSVDGLNVIVKLGNDYIRAA